MIGKANPADLHSHEQGYPGHKAAPQYPRKQLLFSAYKTHGTEAGAKALTSLAATSRRVSMTDNTSLMSKFAETPFSGNNKSPPGS